MMTPLGQEIIKRGLQDARAKEAEEREVARGLDGLSDDEVIAAKFGLERRAKEMLEQASRCEWEIRRRLEQREAQALRGDRYIAELKPGTPTYDESKMLPLLEMLAHADLEKAYTPAHQETKDVDARWDGRQVRVLEKMGGEVARIIEDARIPGRPSLQIKER